MTIVKAKSKLEALKKMGYEHIYWEGKNPYATNYAIAIYYYRIYAIYLKSGEYTFYNKRVN